MSIQPSEIFKDIQNIRKTAPLVHNITNYVVMNNTANALLAIGASPVMAHAVPEVEDMAGIAGSLVINIGTLSEQWVKAMFKAAEVAKKREIPIVIDPVGVGATPYRTETAKALILETAPTIIRGNGSEIMALWGALETSLPSESDKVSDTSEGISTKGVDSSSGSDQAVESAKVLAEKIGCTVCISGETDYIVSSHGIHSIKNGHTMMPKVTGLGCTATAFCGAFAAVNTDFDAATAHAMAVMGIAGEIAAETAPGPGTLQLNFIDALYGLSESDVDTRFKR